MFNQKKSKKMKEKKQPCLSASLSAIIERLQRNNFISQFVAADMERLKVLYESEPRELKGAVSDLITVAEAVYKSGLATHFCLSMPFESVQDVGDALQDCWKHALLTTGHFPT